MSQLSFGLIVMLCTSASAPTDDAVPHRVKNLLQAKCASCHGPGSSAKGGFGYVLDRHRLVQRKQVVPGELDASPIWQRVQDGEMPPKKKQQLTRDEQRLLSDWIVAGAPTWDTSQPGSAPRSLYDVALLVRRDLEVTPSRQRRFLRYLSLSHLAHAGLSSQELERHRQALAKLVNSLSWHPRLTAPAALDEAKTVYRLDLRDYQWSPRVWESLAAITPYEQHQTNRAFRECVTMTTSERPILRGDWFLATASRPPFYHDFLQLPSSARAIERLLRVDVSANLADDNALRAAFNDSGVARNNRLIERHDAAHGAYWRSYDFGGNTDRKNLFRFPLGPSARGNGFDHDGSELIFHLPNGLQGYLLVNALGQRIDKAPTDIVSDPKRPDRAVETGLSCMSCHVKGLLPKADQMRAHVLKSSSEFAKDEREAILALYAPTKTMQQRMDEDMARFQKALSELGVSIDEPEPISAAVLRYEATLDATVAAAEVGLSLETFTKQFQTSPVRESLGALLADGTVQRTLWEEKFDELVAHLETTSSSTASRPTWKPFAGHEGSALGLAFSPNGTRIATGGDDGTVRVWDSASGRLLHTLTGHRGEVRSVTFSPDGTRLVSGGRDRTVRLWQVETGDEGTQLLGHTDQVETVAFSPDGTCIGSASADGSLRVWDSATGKTLQRFTHHRALRTLAFHPTKPFVLTGGDEGTLSLWDYAKGTLRSRWTGHSRAVYAVAFSADGKRAASGGSGRTIRVWDVAKHRELRRLEGHANTVVALAFGKSDTLLSASSQYGTPDSVIRVWNYATGKQLSEWHKQPRERVERAAFSPSGDAVLLSDSQGGVRIVKLIPLTSRKR